MRFLPAREMRWLPVVAAVGVVIAATAFPGVMILFALAFGSLFLLLSVLGARGSSIAYWLTMPFCGAVGWIGFHHLARIDADVLLARAAVVTPLRWIVITAWLLVTVAAAVSVIVGIFSAFRMLLMIIRSSRSPEP